MNKEITLTGKSIETDLLTIQAKQSYVYFNVFIDNCGNEFKISKEKLRELIK